MPVIGVVHDITAIVGRVVTLLSPHGGSKPIVGALNRVFQELNQGLIAVLADIQGQLHITGILYVPTHIKKLLMIGTLQAILVRQLVKLKRNRKHCHALLIIQAVSHKLKQSHALQGCGVHG